MATAEQFYEVLSKNISKSRLAEASLSDQRGLFWDETVLTSEEMMLQGLAKHMDLVVALIDGKLAKDIPRTSISEGLRMLDKDKLGKLFCAKCGSHEEWLRAEGNALKKLLGLVRLTEYRSIDFSRQTATMKVLCEKWRAMTDALGGRRKSKDGTLERSRSMTAGKKTKKAIWEMSVDDVSSLIAGNKNDASNLRSLVQDVFSDTDSLDDDVVTLLEPQEQNGVVSEPSGAGDAVSAGNGQTAGHLENIEEETEKPPAKGAPRYYMDYGKMAIVRCFPSGLVEPGEPIDDDDEPFIWFRWADGIEKQSEFPRVIVRRRPAASIPTESRKKARVEKEEDEEIEEEIEEEEELQEEDEEEEEEDVEEDSLEKKLLDQEEALKKFATQPDSWMAGASVTRNFCNDVIAFNWSNGFGKGMFRVTYAKDQTYCQCHLPDKSKIFFFGITVKYEFHKEIVQSVCSDLLALGEEHYEDLAKLKKLAVKLRDDKLIQYK